MQKKVFFGCLILLVSLSGGPASAADKPKLTVYTYDAFAADWGPAPKLEEAFEATCACDLEFVATDSSIGILRKIQLEGAETQADIALGLDTNLTALAAETGLFAPHGVKADNLALPIDWSDPVFLPFDYGYFAFVYNSETVKSPPASFTELAAAPEDFKIVIQDPRSSTPGLGLLLWIREAYGDKAAEIWAGLSPKILTVTKGWSEAYGLFLEGEAEMVLSYTTSPAYHAIAEDDHRFKAAGFAEGHYLQVEVAAMLKSSQQPELARAFMAFITSDGFQSAIPTGNWMYPAARTETPLPEGFAALPLPDKALLMESAEVEANRRAWIEEWRQALGS